ncbi:hypothetical protein Y032_0001g67 [Ancylostoma ceylanicum]|nr:hypothetical protein Y032_0001g67 [Ancylostoma ceylanicum]
MTLQVLDSISFRRESRVGTLEASDATANNASSPSPCRRFVGDAMDKYLASIGLVKKMMANEKGSSVFRAVCESLAMDQSEYLGLKELVDDELLMRYRLQRLRTGLPEVNKIEDTLAAVVRALRIDIHVYRAVGEEPHIYRCAKRGKKRVEKVLLCESARGHFDLVYPLKDHVNLAYAQTIIYNLLYIHTFGFSPDIIKDSIDRVRADMDAVGTDIQTPSPLSSQSYSDQRFSFKPNDFDDKINRVECEGKSLTVMPFLCQNLSSSYPVSVFLLRHYSIPTSSFSCSSPEGMAGEELVFEGCNFFRQRLTFSVLSGRLITIQNIRKDDDAPGIKDFEAKLLSLLERITNGTRVEINATGTEVRFRPGIITGGVLTMDCGSDRCLSYFLEPMIIISPFCKNAMTLKLKGVTNAPNEVSVDAIKATWLTVYNKFVLNDEKLELKISARGLKPAGGGCVTFSAPIVKTLRPVQREKSGKVCKIRGQAYVTKVTPSLAYRMIDAAKKMLHGYIADVYITVDQRKGDAGGNSPGYGLFLTAETTEGVVYHGEAISKPKGEPGDPLVPEDVGSHAAAALLEEIYRGGCLDSSAQTLACSFMALGQKDVSKFLFGPLTVYRHCSVRFFFSCCEQNCYSVTLFSVHALRHLKSFFEIQFKVDEWRSLRNANNEKGDEEEMRIGSEQKALVTALGIGFSNLNKIVL